MIKFLTPRLLKHIKKPFNIILPKFNFCQKASEKDYHNQFKEELDKLKTTGKLKIYQNRTPQSDNKIILKISMVMGLISGSVILFTSVSWALKLLNSVIFIPCCLIQLDNLLGDIVFIKTIHLLPNDQIEITDMEGKSEIIDLKDIQNSKDDVRFPQRKNFNYQLFDIFTSLKTRKLYHLHKDAEILNTQLLNFIINGKKINL
jgi:hypothetical protein